MKATINLEFTDDELLKYAEDVGRRWAVNFFAEAFKAGKRLKIPPGFLETLASAFTSGVGIGEKGPPDPPSPPGAPDFSAADNHCLRIESCPSLEEGWLCCFCSTYNTVQRAACRACGHGRCDVVVPPPPNQSDPSVQ